MRGYRKELKFIVSDSVLYDVKNRIGSLLQIDEHQKGDFYNIRSIYFDSPDNRCLKEIETGISTREKYRIRIYGGSDTKISAEIKIRHNDTISKISEDISHDELAVLLGPAAANGAVSLLNKRPDSRLLQKYACRIAGEMFRPKVIVQYERCAYIYKTGNVRITFDRNISASTSFDRFFDEHLPGIPALDDNMHVLEIKYDEFLPDEIKLLLGGMGLQREACSKYAQCMYRLR